MFEDNRLFALAPGSVFIIIPISLYLLVFWIVLLLVEVLYRLAIFLNVFLVSGCTPVENRSHLTWAAPRCPSTEAAYLNNKCFSARTLKTLGVGALSKKTSCFVTIKVPEYLADLFLMKVPLPNKILK